IRKANVKADRRRIRRTMTADELERLLDVARQRSLLGALTVRKGKRRGERYANVQETVRQRLEVLVRLTMETYTDPKLLDMRGALDVLLALPCEGQKSLHQPGANWGKPD